MHLALQKLFSDKEIDDIYNFLRTSAFEKFNSERIFQEISFQFQDIDKMIEDMTASFNETDSDSIKTSESTTEDLKPVFTDRENGFYETIDSSSYTEMKDAKLKDSPALTFKDILKVKKVFNEEFFLWEIQILFTKEGARKLTLLTKKNLMKPIAIVLDKQIISMPIVVNTIIGGTIVISGILQEQKKSIE